MERLDSIHDINVVSAKEKTAKKLRNLNDQKLTAFLKKRRRLFAMAVAISYLGDAVFGGSLLGSSIGVISRNEDLVLLFLGTTVTGTSVAFAGAWESQRLQKTIDMVENESLYRGIRPPETLRKPVDPNLLL